MVTCKLQAISSLSFTEFQRKGDNDYLPIDTQDLLPEEGLPSRLDSGRYHPRVAHGWVSSRKRNSIELHGVYLPKKMLIEGLSALLNAVSSFLLAKERAAYSAMMWFGVIRAILMLSGVYPSYPAVESTPIHDKAENYKVLQ